MWHWQTSYCCCSIIKKNKFDYDEDDTDLQMSLHVKMKLFEWFYLQFHYSCNKNINIIWPCINVRFLWELLTCIVDGAWNCSQLTTNSRRRVSEPAHRRRVSESSSCWECEPSSVTSLSTETAANLSSTSRSAADVDEWQQVNKLSWWLLHATTCCSSDMMSSLLITSCNTSASSESASSTAYCTLWTGTLDTHTHTHTHTGILHIMSRHTRLTDPQVNLY